MRPRKPHIFRGLANPLRLYFIYVDATIAFIESRLETSMSDNNGSGLIWFLAGLGIGAAAGVLYAPRSGAETREALRAQAEEGADRARQHARRVRESAGDWIDRGRDTVNEHKENFRAAYEAGRQTYREKTADAPVENL